MKKETEASEIYDSVKYYFNRINQSSSRRAQAKVATARIIDEVRIAIGPRE
jgi:hypothetical protein